MSGNIENFSIFHKMIRPLISTFFVLLASCATVYDLTDRSGNVFAIEHPEVETKGKWEYRTGDAVRELSIGEIVSLSIPNAEAKIFDGKIFYPATLALEDTVSVPARGFVCVEGTLTAENAGQKITIPLSNIKELRRQQKEEATADTTANGAAPANAIAGEAANEANPTESGQQEGAGN